MDIKNVKIRVKTKKLCPFEVWSVLGYVEYDRRTEGCMLGILRHVEYARCARSTLDVRD